MRGRAAATQVPSKIGNVVKVGVTRPRSTHWTPAYLRSVLLLPAHCSAQLSPAQPGSSAGLHLAGARSRPRNCRPRAGRQTLHFENWPQAVWSRSIISDLHTNIINREELGRRW